MTATTGWADVLTRRDLDATRHELRAELQSALRTQFISFTSIVGLFNALTFTVLKLL